MKICSKCGLLKSLKDFNKNRRRMDGRQKWCRDCEKDYYRSKKEQLLTEEEILFVYDE